MPMPSAIPHAPADMLGAATLPVAAVGDMLVTAELLARLGWMRPAVWAGAIGPACRRHGITTRLRVAAFLANAGAETGGGAVLVENLNYDEAGLRRTFSQARADAAAPYARRPGRPADQPQIANAVYGNEWGRKVLGNTMKGDGWRFRGRGLMQLTGKNNYERFAKMVGAVSMDQLIMFLETETGAADSAAQFWEVSGCNALADKRDIVGVRRVVNGGSLGLADVTDRYARALTAMGS